MSYFLATTENPLRFYSFKRGAPPTFELHDRLDVRVATAFADKPSAKAAAQAVGLKTWNYVKVGSTARRRASS